MAVIHVLDKHTAELIAAGEVVERPASVIKELVENALDAGASQISVSITRGGITQMEVADNGCGIEAEYIPTAFVRHATSKIQTKQDLDAIQTLGFRGEALASIASVAKVTLTTKTEQDEFAYQYQIDGGEAVGIQPAARAVGTTITVRDLFYNTPARMKFLKKDISEGNCVAEAVTRLALSHPEVSFSFARDGKTQFNTPGDGSMMAAAYAVLSREFAHDLLEVSYTEPDGSKVYGLVTPPKSGRASRAMQFFYVNGRFVKDRTMMAALEQAYRGMLMQGRFPGCILFLCMPAEQVDVNVHPAKTEVRFAYEKNVFEIIYKAVKGVLLQPQGTEREFSFAQNTVRPAPQQTEQSMPVAAAAKSAPAPVPSAPTAQPAPISRVSDDMPVAAPRVIPVSPVNTQLPKTETAPMMGNGEVVRSGLTVPYITSAAPQPKKAPCEPQPEPQQLNILGDSAPKTENLRYVGEVFNTYIIAQRGEDICFIDKHAAHERSIYEQLASSHTAPAAQMLLAPVTVQLSAEEKNALAENDALLQQNGIVTEDFGGNCVVARTVPCDVIPDDVENLVIELAQRLVQNAKDTLDEKTQWVMHSIACRAAIKAGDKNNAAHLVRLAQQVLDGEIPPFCPHGRPCVLKVTKKELEKQFGRLG